MIKRYLAVSTEISAKEIELPETVFLLEYYITESCCQYEEAKGKPVYGLEVVKKQGNLIENSSIEDYSLCKEETEFLVEKLCNNKVTPIGLMDVVSDLVGVLDV